MPKFRKKPVVIEAMQFVDNGDEIIKWAAGYEASILPDNMEFEGDHEITPCLRIPTLEGEMMAFPNDWIIKGIKNEFYPCNPDIFDATYEVADE